MSEITVIMTAYNGKNYIEEQIQSILTGSFQDFSIRVFDDGSTDGTRELLERLSKEYPEKIVYTANPQNKGVIRNFTEGAYEADSPYIMFSDQDDVWLPDKLLKTLEHMKEQEKKNGGRTPVVVFTDTKVVDEKLKELAPSFHGVSHLDPYKTDLAHLLMENKLIGCTMMINQPLREKLSKVPEKARMHDWWIGLIGASMGVVSYLPEATLLYRQHEKNVVGSQSFGSYVGARLSGLLEQRKVLKKTEAQAEALLELFGSELSSEKREIIAAFASLQSGGFIKKRRILIKYGFWKTGLVRNIGVFLLI